MLDNNSLNIDNFKKSLNGNCFEDSIEATVETMLNHGVIKGYVRKPRYSAPGYEDFQFRPDFEITFNDDSICLVDTTTSIRSDRLKQKQWDALGAKNYFHQKGKIIQVFIVIPNKNELGTGMTRESEFKIVQSLRERIVTNKMFSAVDNILMLDEFIMFLSME